jgi:hypothetical protein
MVVGAKVNSETENLRRTLFEKVRELDLYKSQLALVLKRAAKLSN